MKFEPKERSSSRNGTNTVLAGEFEKKYRFATTKETLDTFYTGVFADTVFSDLQKARVLSVLR